MDAVTLLQDHIDMEELLHHYEFDKVRADGDLIRACCKLHDGNNPTAFVVNTRNNLYYCHTGGCGGGDAFTLVQKLDKVDFSTAVKRVAEFFKVDITDLHIQERKSSYLKEIKSFIQIMQARKKKRLEEYSIDEPIREVAKFRSFQESTLQHFKLGYVESVTLKRRDNKTYTLKDRLVFPIIQEEKQVGISFRRIKTKDVPKWSHQPTEIETKSILYNYDAVLGQPKVVVVEGIPDVWAYHEIGVPAVATFGAHLTDEQYKLLMRTGADIILSYDGDEAGRIATEKAVKMLKYKANLGCVVFDEGEDPESISRDQLKLKYESRKRL